MRNQQPSELTRISQFSLILFILSCILWTKKAAISQIKMVAALPIHTALESVTIVIYVSVFIVCWNAFGEQRKRSSLILAVAFLCSGLLGFLHAISFQGMPGFGDAIDMHKSLSFWLYSQFIVTISLLGLALEPDDSLIDNARALYSLIFGIAMTILLACCIFVWPNVFPLTYSAENGQTVFKIACEIMLVILASATAALFYRQIFADEKTSSDANLKIKPTLLFFASAMMALSEVYFSLYRFSDDLFVAIGHIFQLLAAFAIYRGMVAINIHAPYASIIQNTQELQRTTDELLIHKERLTGVIETAIDGIITIDDTHHIILANPAAAATFGYQVEELIGQSIEVVIPSRHRHVHSKHVNEFGEKGRTKRKMGANFEDYYISGLHAEGHEFPLEASISSLLENGKRFYTVIFRDISERKLAKEKMAQYHNELSQLSAALQSIREEERKHIARELHDDLGQLLAALRMDLSLLQRDHAMTDKSRLTLGSMDQLLLTSITTLRRIATDLRPRALDEGGLYFALQTLQKEFSHRHGVHCDMEADEEQLILDDERSTAIFRIIQESLTNVARHAKAATVNIKFARDEKEISLTISDNGRGIEEGALNKSRSFGLVGMRERVKAMNGEFKVSSEIDRGTTLQIKIPLPSQ